MVVASLITRIVLIHAWLGRKGVKYFRNIFFRYENNQFDLELKWVERVTIILYP